MGGDTISPLSSSIDEEELSSTEQEFPDHFDQLPTPPSVKTKEENQFSFGSRAGSYKSFEVEAIERRRRNVHSEVFRSYDELGRRVQNLEEAKRKVLSYTPGSWSGKMGGIIMDDFNIPKSTTLLLIGPKGSGKSSLVNRISRVFEDDKFAPERAQVSFVSDNSSLGEGTYFLQEYMIPRSFASFCLFDTRSFSCDSSQNLRMIKLWMTKGVRHGELVKWGSDSSSQKARMKCKARENNFYSRRRMVNFVIFVVDGLSVLKSMDTDGAEHQYTEMVARTFNSPFLSFRDDKPVVVITHGDLLSLSDRARVRVYLGDLLGVHPSKQIFDISDNNEPTTDLTIVDMIRYSLEHADRNLPGKRQHMISKSRFVQPSVYILLLVAVCIIAAHIHSSRNLNVHAQYVAEPSLKVDWHKIRHLWLSSEFE